MYMFFDCGRKPELFLKHNYFNLGKKTHIALNQSALSVAAVLGYSLDSRIEVNKFVFV